MRNYCRIGLICLLAHIAVAWAFGGKKPPTKKSAETVVVTGVYRPIPLAEADRSITVINVKKQSLLATELVDLLRLDASVDLEERGPAGTQADVSIRGGTFGQTLILVDGWRMNDAQSGHHDMDIPIPMDAVSSIQVLHGSGSTLYGSDAVGGVVNFVTRRPESTELRVESALGNFGTNQQSATLSTVFTHFDEELDFSRDFSEGFRPDRDYRDLALDSRTDFDTHLGTTEILLAHNDRPFGADQFYGNFDSWERTRTWFGGIRQDLGKKDQVSFAFRRHTDLFVLLRDQPQVYTNRHAVKSYQYAWRHDQPLFTNGNLYTGVEGYGDSIHSNNLGDHTRNRVAGYAAFDMRAFNRFSFTLGAREETYGSLHGVFCPSISGGYWVSGHLKLRGTVSRAFRLPTYTDLYYHDPATAGLATLKPERAWNYEVGADWYPKSRIETQLTLFERQDRDGIDYIKTSPTSLWQAANIDSLTFQGAEASARVRLGRMQELDFSYTALHGSKAPTIIYESQYLFNYLQHSAEIAWQGALPGGLSARTRVGILDRINYEPYGLWDFSIARTRGWLHPFVRLSNLTNTSYEEIQGVPMPGRSVIAGLDLTLYSRKR